MDGERLCELVSAGTLQDAVAVVAASLGEGTRVWVTERGIRRRLTGAGPEGHGRADALDPVAVTAGCGTRIEVAADAPRAEVSAVAVALGAVADRLAAAEATAAARRRLEATEELGGLGSFDWDVTTGRLRWSAGLYRIYGQDPDEFEPTYERFLDLVHPDDRARLREIHEDAVEAGRSFETDERIVRPDGRVRSLRSLGLAHTDEEGRVLRLHGVCRDVTEHLTAEHRAQRAAARFDMLIDASPDAVVVIDAGGRIASVNPQAARLFGYATDDLVGMSVDELVPGPGRGRHARLREEFMARPTARPMAAGTDLRAMRADGRLVAVDIALTPLDHEAGGVVAAFVRDATQRREAERDRRRMAEAQIRRRQALELNDNVVQSLVALLWELGDDGDPLVHERAQRTLAAARGMMADLLEDASDEEGLTRTGPAAQGAPSAPAPTPPPDPATPPPDSVRVLIADDVAALRQLLRIQLSRLDGVEVVDEAHDGQRAVELCERHQPDVVLLDLSMPVLDGFQAAELIRQRVPRTRILVLSGYPEDTMRDRALRCGAEDYFEKGADLTEVCARVAEQIAGAPATPSPE